MTSIINQDHTDIIRYYNAVTYGLVNYYSFADNQSSFGQIWWYIRRSCAQTLASKFKLHRMAGAFKKFGAYLRCPDTDVSLYKPDFKRKRLFTIGKDQTLEMLEKTWAGKQTRFNLKKRCIVCGNGKNIEMHHLRKIRELLRKKHLNWYQAQMASINRKQVPQCHYHHLGVHNDTLTPTEKQMFKGLKALVAPLLLRMQQKRPGTRIRARLPARQSRARA